MLIEEIIRFVGEYLIYLLLLFIPLLIVTHSWRLALRVFLAVSIAFFIASSIKYFFPTLRPFVQEGIEPLVSQSPDASFPSIHTAVASALSVAILIDYRRLGTLLLGLSVLIGIARVLALVHYPVDIIGGFVLGILAALFVYRLRVSL